MRTRILAGAAVGLMTLLPLMPAGPAWAQAASVNQPLGGISVTTRGSVEGTITAIDLPSRTVTVQTSDGRTVRGKVSDAVGGLETVRTGDRIVAAYEQKLSFVLSGPNAATPSDRMSGTSITTGGATLPTGAANVRAVATWVVVSTNTSANTISMVDPGGGRIETFDVNNPDGRMMLPKVKPGDKLTASLIENVFAAVTKK